MAVSKVLAANNADNLGQINTNVDHISLRSYLKSYVSIKFWRDYAKRDFKNSKKFYHFFNSSKNLVTKNAAPFIFGGILGTVSTKIFYSLYLNKELSNCWQTNADDFHICQSQLFALRNKANF
jgi:hypothetical protein